MAKHKLTLTYIQSIQKALFYLSNASGVTLTAFVTTETAQELQNAGIANFSAQKTVEERIQKYSGIKPKGA